jgi:hypothetical protein
MYTNELESLGMLFGSALVEGRSSFEEQNETLGDRGIEILYKEQSSSIACGHLCEFPSIVYTPLTLYPSSSFLPIKRLCFCLTDAIFYGLAKGTQL